MTKYNHLTEKDIKDGEEILEIMDVISDLSRKMALVYLGALRDKEMLDKKTA